VSITSPINGAAFAAGTNITITAIAADSDGTVASVEFHEGTNVLGNVANSPYSFTWNNVAAGTYTLTADATDNLGQKTTSGSVTITVTAGPSQPVSITSVLASTNALTLTWTGGAAPYLVQMKSNLSDTNWFDVMTTTNQSAIVARARQPRFLRIADQASETVTPFTVAMNGAAGAAHPRDNQRFRAWGS
jgi:chitinase